MITPTIGRVVWVHRANGSQDHAQPEPALVCYVWDDRLINVAGFDKHGSPFALTSLTLVQDNEPKPEGNYAEWMPYQKDQAAKQVPASGTQGGPSILTLTPPKP